MLGVGGGGERRFWNMPFLPPWHDRHVVHISTFLSQVADLSWNRLEAAISHGEEGPPLFPGTHSELFFRSHGTLDSDLAIPQALDS